MVFEPIRPNWELQADDLQKSSRTYRGTDRDPATPHGPEPHPVGGALAIPAHGL